MKKIARKENLCFCLVCQECELESSLVVNDCCFILNQLIQQTQGSFSFQAEQQSHHYASLSQQEHFGI